MSGEQVYYKHLKQLGELTLIVEEITQFSGEMIKVIMIENVHRDFLAYAPTPKCD